jgi:glycosyltransferase involved in cell wall biosynthesis
MPRVLIVRGHQVTPWELGPWLELPPRYEVRCLLTGSNRFTAPSGIEFEPVRALRDVLPTGLVGDVVTRAVGDRYLSAPEAFAWADLVHAEELPFWFSADAARRKRRQGFRLVQTVWETLPLMSTFRSRQARRNRRTVLAETDLFLPTTERAALALRLEGVDEERIRVCPPGIDVDRFATAVGAVLTPRAHVIVSAGRLVWEKGHQDVLRALALLHRGIVTRGGAMVAPRLQIIGAGPEERRLRAYAAELGLGDVCDIVSVPYDEMPARLAAASAMVLASQSSAAASYHPLGIPHVFWEEQFGMVLAEAMASGLEVVATTSGAIPEVLDAGGARLVAPGDWRAIAQALADGALSRPPGTRVAYPPELISHYSTSAAARRLADAYDAVLA